MVRLFTLFRLLCIFVSDQPADNSAIELVKILKQKHLFHLYPRLVDMGITNVDNMSYDLQWHSGFSQIVEQHNLTDKQISDLMTIMRHPGWLLEQLNKVKRKRKDAKISQQKFQKIDDHQDDKKVGLKFLLLLIIMCSLSQSVEVFESKISAGTGTSVKKTLTGDHLS